MRPARQGSTLLTALFALAGCVGSAGDGEGAPGASEPAAETGPGTAGSRAGRVALGPADGHDLPPTDLERVTAGDLAPDFTAMSRAGEPITLSDYRGDRNVVLFFYRGHW